MENEIIKVGGKNWKVRQARSLNDALNAISSARCSGSIAQIDTLDETYVGGGITVLADVIQINSDGTERQPYTESY